MVFMESDKEVEIYVYLHNNKELFQAFVFNGEGSVIMKFDIRDLELIGLIFENPQIAITLIFTKDAMRVWYENEFVGWT